MTLQFHTVKMPAMAVAAVLLALAGCGGRGERYMRLGRNPSGHEEFLWLADSALMVRVPAGSLAMGPEPDSAGPGLEVFLDEYFIDRHEVTNRQYRKFCDATRREYPPIAELGSLEDYFTGYPDHPVVAVSWDDATAYCRWVGKRLPTEAEWEKAARGTDMRSYPWGNEAPDAGGAQRANWGVGNDRDQWRQDGYEFTAPVGVFDAGESFYGCMDMAGNVREWCADWYQARQPVDSMVRDPRGPATGLFRVARGGAWNSDAWDLRSDLRAWYDPSSRNSHKLGFRCAWTP